MSAKFLKIITCIALLALLFSACQTTTPAATEPLTAVAAQATEAPFATYTPWPTRTPPPTAPLREPLWTFDTKGAVYSSPTVRDGVVYIGSDDKSVYALDAATGKMKWQFQTEGIVRCRPALDDTSLYVASDDGFLYALDPQTGKQQWTLDIGNAKNGRQTPANDFVWDYLQSSPTVVDGKVYVGSADDGLYAVDAKSGEQIWRFETADIVRSSPAVADGIVYVGSRDGFIYAVDAESGKEVWKVDATGQWNAVQPSPLVVDGVVYIGSRSYRLFALDAKTGQEKWVFNYVQGWVESSATIADGILYVGSSEDRALYAIDSATGKQDWMLAVDGVIFSSPIVDQGVVYAGSTHWTPGLGYNFYALDIKTGKDGKRMQPYQAKWRVEAGETVDTSEAKLHGFVSSPAIANDVVYIGGLDGKVYAISTLP